MKVVRSMIDFQKIFHTGYLVPDLDLAMQHYGVALGLNWAKPFTFEELPLWTPGEGLHHLRLEVIYSTEGPHHLELQKGPAGSYYDPVLRSGHHVGIWVEDVAAAVGHQQAHGWTVQAAGTSPEDGYGAFVYLEPPGGGLTVELVSTDLRPVLESWWNGGEGPA